MQFHAKYPIQLQPKNSHIYPHLAVHIHCTIPFCIVCILKQIDGHKSGVIHLDNREKNENPTQMSMVPKTFKTASLNASIFTLGSRKEDYLVHFTHIRRISNYFTAHLLQSFLHLLNVSLLAGTDSKSTTLLCQSKSNSSSNSTRGTCNTCYFPFQLNPIHW